MTERTTLNKLPGRAALLLFGAVTAAYLIMCAVINFRGFELFATPDMYSDTLVSMLMWDQKTLFPEGWVFGNQFYVLATPNIAALLYGITGSPNLAMVLATEIMTALIIVAFIWMAKPFCSTEALGAGVLAIMAVVICPSAPDHLSGQLFYLMASYYACYLIHILVVLGVYLRLYTEPLRRRTPSMVIALVLSFVMGMQSIRQTAVVVLPLVCAEIFLRLLHRANRRTTIFAALVLVTNVLGIIFIRLLDVDSVSIYGSFSASGSSLLADLKEDLLAGMGVTGLRSYQYGMPSLIVYAVALIACVIALPFHSLRHPLAVAALVCALGIAAALAANVVIDLELRSIYLFGWFPLAAIAVLLLYDKLGARRVLQLGMCVVFCAFAVFNLVKCYLPSAQRSLNDTDDIQERQLADFIVDNGYDYIYAQWYFGSRVAVRTDGAAIAGTWHDEPLEILGYINPQNIYSEEDNSRAVYIVTDEELDAFLARAEELGATVTKVCDTYNLDAYESSKQLMYFPENS